jgi:hypothetical protein
VLTHPLLAPRSRMSRAIPLLPLWTRRGLYRVTLTLNYLLTCLLTYLLYGAESSWEANRFAASQEFPRILWNPKVHYRIHKGPPPVHILKELNPVHNLTSHFLKIHLNIILQSTPGSPPVVSFPQVSSPKSFTLLFHRATCPAHIIFFNFITHTVVSEEYGSLSSSLWN